MEDSLDEGKGSFENVMSKMDISHPRGGTEWIGAWSSRLEAHWRMITMALVPRDRVMDERAQEEPTGEMITLEKYYL